MNPPKCRFCGVEEWKHTCARNQTRKVAVKVNRTAVADSSKPKKTRDRRKYQRELMRKRRGTDPANFRG